MTMSGPHPPADVTASPQSGGAATNGAEAGMGGACSGCNRIGVPLLMCDDLATENSAPTPHNPMVNSKNRYCAQCMIGKKVRVFWPLDEQWYVGVVRQYDENSGEHMLTYPDGDTEWVKIGDTQTHSGGAVGGGGRQQTGDGGDVQSPPRIQSKSVPGGALSVPSAGDSPQSGRTAEEGPPGSGTRMQNAPPQVPPPVGGYPHPMYGHHHPHAPPYANGGPQSYYPPMAVSPQRGPVQPGKKSSGASKASGQTNQDSQAGKTPSSGSPSGVAPSPHSCGAPGPPPPAPIGAASHGAPPPPYGGVYPHAPGYPPGAPPQQAPPGRAHPHSGGWYHPHPGYGAPPHHPQAPPHGGPQAPPGGMGARYPPYDPSQQPHHHHPQYSPHHPPHPYGYPHMGHHPMGGPMMMAIAGAGGKPDGQGPGGTKKKSGPKTWTKEEDAILLNMVKTMRMPMKWSVVAQSMPDRTGKQCRERYVNHLNPRLKVTDWNPMEDATIFHLYNSIGSQWAKMAKMIPGRTDNGIKNRFHNLRRQLEREDEHRMKLSDAGHFPDEVQLDRIREFPPQLRGKTDELWNMHDGIGVLAAQSVLGSGMATRDTMKKKFGPFRAADKNGERCARCGLFAPSVQCGPEICEKTKWCQSCTRIPPNLSGNLLRECLNLRKSQDASIDKIVKSWASSLTLNGVDNGGLVGS